MKTLLEELDLLIATQAKLQFSQHNYDEAAAEVYGIALLDFIRVRGVELRSALAASPAPAQPEGGDAVALVRKLIAQDEASIAECDAMAERIGRDEPVGREITRDAAQYRQSAHRLKLVLAELTRPVAAQQAVTDGDVDGAMPCRHSNRNGTACLCCGRDTAQPPEAATQEGQ